MNLRRRIASVRREFLHRITHFTEHSDFFIVQRYFEKLFAIHFVAEGWRGRTLWYLYRTLYGLIYLSYVHKAYWVLSHWQPNSLSNANILGVLWFFSAVILRVAILEWYYPVLMCMRTFLNDHSYQRSDPWTFTRRADFYRRSNRFTLAVMTVNFIEIICFAATNVLMLEDFMLQFRGQVVGEWPVQIVYGVLTMCWGGMYCMGFMMCHMLLCTFWLEIDILLHSLAQVGRELRPAANHLEGNDGSVFWGDIIENLRPHIYRLEDLLSNLQKLKIVIGPIAFVQYYSTYLVIADCCLILASGGVSSYSIVYIISMTVFLTESFLLCRGIENLRDLKPRIAAVLYDFDWTLQLHCSDRRMITPYRQVKQTFLLITAQSGETINFSFAGVGEISMNSFAQLLEKSYSMLTFLLQFAK